GTIRFEFNGLPTSSVDHLGAVLDLFALSAVLPPLDVVVSLRMNFDFSSNSDLVAKFTVRLHDGGVEVPVLADFHLFEDVDAIFAAVAVAAFGHVCEPLFRL